MLHIIRRLTLILGVISLVGVHEATAAAAASDNPSDIPGVALPAPVVSGQLGGPIYDVVYRIDVPPQRVIVIGLTGSPGTDFDLYLFDSTATTVVSEAGLVASSTGPTSDESLSYATLGGGTYYVDLNGATNVEGAYGLSVQVVPDQTPPLATLSLDGGRAATNETTVDAEVRATDDLSGVTDMAFSEDGVTFSGWMPIAPAHSWTFTAGDGTKNLWVEVRNGVGLVSAPAKASIVLDTIAPSIVELVPSPSAASVAADQVFSATFSEPVDPATWLQYGLIVQSADGGLVAGSYSYDAASRTGTFEPLQPLVLGHAYVVTLGAVRDTAGNPVASPGSWVLTVKTPTSLSITASPAVVAPGAAVNLSGTIAPSSIGSVDFSEATISPSGDVAFVYRSTVAGLGGSVAIAVRPASNTIYRFAYAGDADTAAAIAQVRVLVRRSISLAGVSPTVTRTVRAGTPIRLTAQIGPAAAGVPVSFRLYRYNALRRTWIYVGSWGRTTDGAGRANLTWTNGSRGSFYWRVAVASTPDFANGISPVYRWVSR